MVTYDYNTGKPLAPGQAQSVYNIQTGQKIGTNTYSPASIAAGVAPAGAVSSGGGGGGSSTVVTTAPPISSANLKVGSTGSGVANLQTYLNSQGANLVVDGKFGPLTDAAVKAYQTTNKLTADGIVGKNTSASMNGITPTAPATKPIDFTVPNVVTPYEAPKQDTTQLDSYILSLPEQNANAQIQIDNARNQQIEQNQQNQQREQQIYDDAMASENTAIMEEQRLKLDAYTTNMARYNKAYNDKQALLSQLNTLTTQGNALILAQKSTTGLTSIRNPRVNETISEITGAAAILQTSINENNTDMAYSNNIINTAMSAITSTYQNQIDYYKVIADTADKKLITLTAAEQDFIQVTIDNLQKKKDAIQTNVDYIQKLMITPESATFIAKAGISLNDSPGVINQKMAIQSQKDEIIDTKNKYVTDGYTYVPFPTSNVGLVPITAGGQTLYFKAPVKGTGGTGGTGGNGTQLASDISTAQQFVADNPNVSSAELELEIKKRLPSLTNADVKSVLATKKLITRERIEATATQGVVSGGLSATYTENELKDLADQYGYSKWFTGAKKDIERFLNSPDAKTVYVDLLYKQYQVAGMTD